MVEIGRINTKIEKQLSDKLLSDNRYNGNCFKPLIIKILGSHLRQYIAVANLWFAQLEKRVTYKFLIK